MSAVTIERGHDRIIDGTPLRRVGNDQDLKGIVVLFASEASAFITGQIIAVDGGATAI
jgi:gluconate 5-dehydrogenase